MNFRFFLILAVIMIFSIIMIAKVFVSQNSKIILMIAVLSLLAINVVLLIVFRKKFFMFLAFVLLVMLLPTISIYSSVNKLERNCSLNVETCIINGKIYKIDENLENNNIYIYLTDVKLKSQEQSVDFYGKFLVKLNSDNVETSKIEVGRFITVKGEPEYYQLQNQKYTSSIAKNVNASVYAYSYTMWFEDRVELNLRDKVRASIYSLFESVDLLFADVGYAMIFGETSVVNDKVYDVFKSTGIAHLLAVSGFHISVIVTAIVYILKKFKANKGVQLGVVAFVVVFYAYLCDFSVSIIRAGIMSLVLLYSEIRNKEYDRLNALSFACCLILLFNPLDVFNISFALSFVAVLSIILLMQPLERLFKKIFYDKFASSLSLCVAVSLGMTMFQLYYFKKAPLFSFVANMVTVPIVSVLFIYLLLVVLILPIFHISAPFIKFYGIIMKYILQFNNMIAGVGLSIGIGNIGEISLLLSLILMFVVSDYVFLKPRNKCIISGVLVVALMLLMII